MLCRVMGNMFKLSWKSLQEQTSTADAKAVPQCPSSGLELGVKTTWQLCTSWGVKIGTAHTVDGSQTQQKDSSKKSGPPAASCCMCHMLLLFPEMMGMEGLPAILFGSEQNARGRRCLGRFQRSNCQFDTHHGCHGYCMLLAISDIQV